MYAMGNNQISVIRIFITLNISHFFVLGTFKFLSSSSLWNIYYNHVNYSQSTVLYSTRTAPFNYLYINIIWMFVSSPLTLLAYSDQYFTLNFSNSLALNWFFMHGGGIWQKMGPHKKNIFKDHYYCLLFLLYLLLIFSIIFE
jgi:hypothetical protein